MTATADDIRERLWQHQQTWYRAQRPMPAVSLSQEEFITLKQAWDPITDGPPDFYPDNEPFHWRDVPFVVRRVKTDAGR